VLLLFILTGTVFVSRERRPCVTPFLENCLNLTLVA
jgi:hypothetical protein